MPEFSRVTQKVFAQSVDVGQFGSAAATTKITTQDLATIQALPAYLTGWSTAAISGERLPTIEEMNGLFRVVTEQLAYIFQEGIPEYDAGTTYYQNSIARKTGTYELYGSLIADNTGNALPVQTTDANWEYLGDLSKLAEIAGLETGGIFEYDGALVYNQTDVVRKPATYELYGSEINGNVGNALPAQVDDANWKYLGKLQDLTNIPSIGSAYEVLKTNASGTAFESGLVTTDNLEDATLKALAGLATGSNKIPRSTGTDTFDQLDFSTSTSLGTSNTTIASQNAVKQYVDNNVPDLGLTQRFTSGELTVVVDNQVSVSHGLGGVPELISVSLRCKVAEGGYAVNEEVLIGPGVVSSTGYTASVNSSSVLIQTGQNGLFLYSKTTYTTFSLNESNWRYVVRAWR